MYVTEIPLILVKQEAEVYAALHKQAVVFSNPAT
jgi:hypothetical protein